MRPAGGSPCPTVSPPVAGAWSTNGDSEYFTPASTLEPCTTYNLTIPAAIHATGQTPLGKTRTLALNVVCPPVKAFQQALARLGYLPYTFHSIYGIHLPDGRETRSMAAHYAFHPPTGVLRANVHDAPPLDYGQLDETTQGALTVFEAAHGIESSRILWRLRRPDLGEPAGRRDGRAPRSKPLYVRNRHGVLARDIGGTQG